MVRTREQGSEPGGGLAVLDSGEFEAWELDDRAAWLPAGALPIRVRALGGESNGSYLDRLARGNGLSLDRLLRGLGEGTFASEPDAAEVYFNPAALQLLSVVCGRPAEHLRRALPSLAPQRMLAQGPDPVWQWPWRRACTLVPACQLCAARHGAQGPAWLASTDGWQVCARHGRWLDDGRRAGRGFVDLGPLPQVLAAHRERIVLQRRLGPLGRALFADAFHIAAYWWTCREITPRVWGVRARTVRIAPTDVRGAALAFYPEAVALARALAQAELAHRRGTLTAERYQDWQERTQALAIGWGVRRGSALADPLRRWALRHRLTPDTTCAARIGRVSGAGRCAGHQHLATDAPGEASGGLAQETCLPWRLGSAVGVASASNDR